MNRWWITAVALLWVGCNGSDDETPAQDGGGGSGGTVILDGGGTIPEPPVGANFCAAGVCNYQDQDCASGQSCLPSDAPPATGEWPPECFGAGTKSAGEACSQWSECAAGHFCAGIGASSPGVCRKLCCGGDWSACPSGQSCYQQLFLVRPGGGEAQYAKADLCAPVNDCDVFDSSACESGKSCQIVDPTGNVACITSGTGDVGDSCDSASRCKAGFSCVGSTCRRLCRAVAGGGEPSCPPAEGICVHFVGDPEGVGQCTPTG